MSYIEDIQNQKSYQYLHEVESISQDILTSKTSKLELSNARNKLREALRSLEVNECRRTWVHIGSIYIERPTTEVLTILRKELGNTDTDIEHLNTTIKDKVHKLRDLEHEPKLEGYKLKPMSYAEAKALNKGFGLI